MKAKIVGMVVLLAGTATVFAATHKSIGVDDELDVNGVAGFIETGSKGLGLEMEFVGLQPNSLYVARLENSACQNLPKKISAFPNGPSIAMFVESNAFGTYSTVMSRLPADAKATQSVALYKERGDSQDEEIVTVYCKNIG